MSFVDLPEGLVCGSEEEEGRWDQGSLVYLSKLPCAVFASGWGPRTEGNPPSPSSFPRGVFVHRDTPCWQIRLLSENLPEDHPLRKQKNHGPWLGRCYDDNNLLPPEMGTLPMNLLSCLEP